MLDCLTDGRNDRALPIHVVDIAAFDGWFKAQSDVIQTWLDSISFCPKAGASALLPDTGGKLSGALFLISNPAELWDYASLRESLPDGDWYLPSDFDDDRQSQAVLGWALGAYRFGRYKKQEADRRRLVVDGHGGSREAQIIAEAVYLGRDLVNIPANDMGPAELEAATVEVARRFDAEVTTIEGESLLDRNFPAIHAVGQASHRAPRLIDLQWGDDTAPKVTLVGKGVCFDTGGLDIKPAAGMLLMKKDMGGAAATLAAAQAVMALNLPVRLRLLIGAVENSIGGNAFRPGDVIATRKGSSVEIGNTDAEGRLVLADLLALGDADKPDLMIDCATLTGAARVALGADLPALFTPDNDLAAAMLQAGADASDPLWRLPLHQPYRDLIDSSIADINNAGSSGMAGTITAALFLKEFVTETRNWAHLDIYSWTPAAKPGRPKGGEATAVRALVELIRSRFEPKN